MKFSIVIPVYRTEHLLKRCLDSFAAQTDGDFEAIVVEDGRAEGGERRAESGGRWAEEIVSRYDERFKYVRHERNRSLFQARQTGLKMAQGEYVIPFDSDDYALPELLAELKKAASHSNNPTIRQSDNSPDVIAYQMMFDRNGTIAKTSIRYQDESMTGAEALDRLFASRIPCAICGKAIRREVYLKAMADLAAPPDLYLNSSEDLLQTFPILLNARTVATITYPGYRYCVNRSGSLTTTLTDPVKLGKAAENTARVFELLAGFVRRTPRGGERERRERLLARLEGFKRTTVRWYRECIQSLPSTEKRACEAELVRHFGTDLIPHGRISPAASAKIVNISFGFVLFVAACHVGWVADCFLDRVLITSCVSCLGRAVIPFYFAVSGYFLAVHFTEPDWWPRALRKRVRTIFVPYLCWQTVYAVVMLALTGRWIAGWGGLVGLNLCRLPIVGPLWYLRALLLFVLISPLLKCAVSRWGLKWILAMYAVNLATSILTGNGLLEYESGLGGFLGYGLAVEGLVYFSLGLYLRDHPVTFKSPRLPFAALSVGVALIALRIFLETRGVPLYIHPSVLISPFLVVGIWHFAPTRVLPRWLTACTFPIYVMHLIVYSALWICGIPRTSGWQWLTYASGIAIPVLVSVVVRRASPRLARVIFGGR